ncbi:hypothetical protein [Thermoflexus sp.]|uniref:hypothetical protein n=1 Tax=Thermoflexus sp. TaxID=1969742 RepID=UPI0035E41DAB
MRVSGPSQQTQRYVYAYDANGNRFGVRLYDPRAGVWVVWEPLPGQAWAPRAWHRYQYAFASPVNSAP